MARMPGVKWVGEQSPRNRMDRYDIVCIHTIVGFAPAHAAHFSVAGSGKIYQSRDTQYQSAANLNGNHRIIAIENADHGGDFPNWDVNNGHAVPGFTDAQIESIAKILAWAHKTHGIPLQLCPNSKSGSKGLAYHRQGIDGNFGDYKYPGRVSGGEEWTEHFGKVCPGDRRISARKTILNRAIEIAGGDDMPSVNDLLNAKLNPDAEKSETVRSALNKGADALAVVRQMQDGSYQRDKALAAALAALATDTKDDATREQLTNVRKALQADIDSLGDQITEGQA